MTVFSELREKLKSFYGRWSAYIQPVLQFLLAWIIFSNINESMGYMELLNNVFILLILALLCAILPLNAIVIIGGVMIIAHAFALGIEIGAVTLLLFLLLYLLYFRLVAKDALGVLLAPVACSFGMPGIVPLTFGLLSTPVSAVSTCLGTFIYAYLQVIRKVVEPMKASADQNILENVQTMMQKLMQQREMLVLMIAGAAAVVIVSLIRKSDMQYAWYLALTVGTVAYLFLVMMGNIFLQAGMHPGVILLGSVGSYLIVMIVGFFCYRMDYRRTEYLQYEDDEYTYYVKAVPKSELRAPSKKEKDYSDIDFEGKLEESLEQLK